MSAWFLDSELSTCLYLGWQKKSGKWIIITFVLEIPMHFLGLIIAWMLTATKNR